MLILEVVENLRCKIGIVRAVSERIFGRGIGLDKVCETGRRSFYEWGHWGKRDGIGCL